jgi:hypothetical protein
LHGPVGQRLTEYSIPSLYAGSTLAELNTPIYISTILQGPTDGFEGRINDIHKGRGGNQKYGVGVAISGTTLIVDAYDGYSASDESHFKRTTTLSNTSITGPWHMTQEKGPTFNASFTSGSIAEIPTAWRASFGGKTHMGGIGSLSVISRTSQGPSIHAFNLADFVAGRNASSRPLVWYSESVAGCTSSTRCLMRLGAAAAWYMGGGQTQTAANTAYWMNADRINGMVIPEGYRTVLVFGTHATGKFCYGMGGNYTGSDRASSDPYLRYAPFSVVQKGDLDDGLPGISNVGDNRCPDPAGVSKGEHAYPYKAWIWAYDLNDLARVYAGEVNPYDVMPYASVELPGMDTFITTAPGILGGGYDRAGKRIFLNGTAAAGGVALRITRVFTHP